MDTTPLRRRPVEPQEDDSWLITFADMATLLMCFFVLMFSMSSPDYTQFKKVAEALREKGFYNDAIPTEDPYEKMRTQLSMSLGASGYDQFIALTENKEGVEVELSSGAFFLPGSAKFSNDALPMLHMLSKQILPLAKQDIIIEIDGHTDDSPLTTTQYPTNWELSSARATNVVRYLIAQGFPANKLRAVGLADTQPKAPNRDEAGNAIPANQDLNRRVVIKMIKGEDN